MANGETWTKEPLELSPGSGLWGWAIRDEMKTLRAWVRYEADAEAILEARAKALLADEWAERWRERGKVALRQHPEMSPGQAQVYSLTGREWEMLQAYDALSKGVK